MEEAIKRAIEGGYDVERGYVQCKSVGDRDRFALLDPTFWQCLGKSLKWSNYQSPEGLVWNRPIGGIRIPVWKWQMHHFLDHIIEGKDVNSFFAALLK